MGGADGENLAVGGCWIYGHRGRVDGLCAAVGACGGGWLLGLARGRVAACNAGRAVAVSEVSDRILGPRRLVGGALGIPGAASAGENGEGGDRRGISSEPSWLPRPEPTGADQLHWTNSGDGAKLGPQHWMVLSGRSPHEWSSPVDTDAKAPSGGSAWPQ